MTDPTARILVVDDEEPIRQTLVQGLSRAGYHCAAARDAIIAAELLRRDWFDLVLLDIFMPGMSGVDFLQDIGTQHPDVDVIMLTGGADVSTVVTAMQDGACDYVTKPVTFAELIRRVERTLTRRALAVEQEEYQRKLA